MVAGRNTIYGMATEYLYINTRDELLRIECSKIVYMEGGPAPQGHRGGHCAGKGGADQQAEVVRMYEPF